MLLCQPLLPDTQTLHLRDVRVAECGDSTLLFRLVKSYSGISPVSTNVGCWICLLSTRRSGEATGMCAELLCSVPQKSSVPQQSIPAPFPRTGQLPGRARGTRSPGALLIVPSDTSLSPVAGLSYPETGHRLDANVLKHLCFLFRSNI